MNYDEMLIYLNAKGISNKEIIKIEEFFSENNLTVDDLKSITYIGEIKNQVQNSTYKKLLDYDETLLERLFEYNKKLGINVVTKYMEEYPENLKLIENAPLVLYYMGSIENSAKVAIVGARNHSEYGTYVTRKIVGELCEMGVEIVSGMAYGIDSIAHYRALEENKRTTCVLGTGVDYCYPSRNENIYSRAKVNGCVISEYPPTTTPLPYRFPERNRIISGISDAIVVIEAKDKSGSLITAGLGAEQGKEVFAVPGNINSEYSVGTNKLIRDGASILLSVEDLVNQVPKLKDLNTTKKVSEISTKLGEDELEIYNLISRGISDVDSIVKHSRFNVSYVNGILTVLEIKGFIFEESMGRFLNR